MIVLWLYNELKVSNNLLILAFLLYSHLYPPILNLAPHVIANGQGPNGNSPIDANPRHLPANHRNYPQLFRSVRAESEPAHGVTARRSVWRIVANFLRMKLLYTKRLIECQTISATIGNGNDKSEGQDE